MKNKVKTYRLGISRLFPATHRRSGEYTQFSFKIETALKNTEAREKCKQCQHKNSAFCIACDVHISNREEKLHTCRANYLLWKKRIDEVNEGKAELVLFEWIGKPYRSKQRELFRFDKDSGIGVQKLEFIKPYNGLYYTNLPVNMIDNPIIDFICSPGIEYIAKNDGLSIEDFKSWFAGYDLSEPMAVIQFTKFRY